MTSSDGFGLVLWSVLAVSFLAGFMYITDPDVVREIGDVVMRVLGACSVQCQ